MEQKTPKEEKSEKSSLGIIPKSMAISLSREETLKNNTEVLNKLELGDLVKFRRRFYDHWAVYIGEDDSTEDSKKSVIHWWKGTKEQCKIRIDPFWDIVMDGTVEKDNTLDNTYPDHYRGKNVVDRAKQKLSAYKEESYNIVFNNCEHFAKWCRYNLNECRQVQTVVKQVVMPIAQEIVHNACAMFGAKASNMEERQTLAEFDTGVVGMFGVAQGINKREEQEKETDNLQGSDTHKCQE